MGNQNGIGTDWHKWGKPIDQRVKTEVHRKGLKRLPEETGNEFGARTDQVIQGLRSRFADVARDSVDPGEVPPTVTIVVENIQLYGGTDYRVGFDLVVYFKG